jgi:hypothetical protein
MKPKPRSPSLSSELAALAANAKADALSRGRTKSSYGMVPKRTASPPARALPNATPLLNRIVRLLPMGTNGKNDKEFGGVEARIMERDGDWVKVQLRSGQHANKGLIWRLSDTEAMDDAAGAAAAPEVQNRRAKRTKLHVTGPDGFVKAAPRNRSDLSEGAGATTCLSTDVSGAAIGFPNPFVTLTEPTKGNEDLEGQRAVVTRRTCQPRVEVRILSGARQGETISWRARHAIPDQNATTAGPAPAAASAAASAAAMPPIARTTGTLRNGKGKSASFDGKRAVVLERLAPAWMTVRVADAQGHDIELKWYANSIDLDEGSLPVPPYGVPSQAPLAQKGKRKASNNLSGFSELVSAVRSESNTKSAARMQKPFRSTEFELGFAPEDVQERWKTEMESKQTKPLAWATIKNNIYRCNKQALQELDEDSGPCGCLKQCDDDCMNWTTMQECSSEVCALAAQGGDCGNQRFQKPQATKVTARDSGQEGKGWGLFATENIKSQEFVIEFVGEVIDDQECETRLKALKKRGEKHFFMLMLQREAVIDARYKGNNSRFINHSCNPNVEIQKWNVKGHIRLGLFALREITAGSELSIDYRFTHFTLERWKCLCGMPECAGWLDATSAERRAALDASQGEKEKGKGRKRKRPVEQRPKQISSLSLMWNAQRDEDAVARGGFSGSRLFRGAGGSASGAPGRPWLDAVERREPAQREQHGACAAALLTAEPGQGGAGQGRTATAAATVGAVAQDGRSSAEPAADALQGSAASSQPTHSERTYPGLESARAGRMQGTC